MQINYYPENVMKYLNTLPNAGVFEDDNSNILTSQQGEVADGIVIKLFVQYQKLAETKNNVIIDKVRYLVYGNGYIIAAMAMLSEDLVNKPVKAVTNYSFASIIKTLEIPSSKIDSLKIIKQALDDIYIQIKTIK